MTEIIWRNPPGRVHTRSKIRSFKPSKYAETVQKLRENPGRWALFVELTSAGLAIRINNGINNDFTPAGTFEAVARDVDMNTQQAAVYVRYIGENGEYK